MFNELKFTTDVIELLVLYVSVRSKKKKKWGKDIEGKYAVDEIEKFMIDGEIFRNETMIDFYDMLLVFSQLQFVYVFLFLMV